MKQFILELWWQREWIPLVWMCSGGCKLVYICGDFVHAYFFTSSFKYPSQKVHTACFSFLVCYHFFSDLWSG